MATREIVGYEFGGVFRADASERKIFRRDNSQPVPLSPKEFEVLYFFLQNAGQKIRRNEVLPLPIALGDPRQRALVDGYVAKINKALGWKRGEFFKSIRGVGYLLDIQVAPVLAEQQIKSREMRAISDLNFNEHTVASMRAAVEHYKKVIELNPETAYESNVWLAYLSIDLSHAPYCAELPSKAVQEARAAAQTAISIDNRRGPAYGALGLIKWVYDYDWAAAEAYFRKALELDPNDTATMLSYAHLLVASGRNKEGITVVRKAVGLDVTDKIVHVSWPWLVMMTGDREGAYQLSKPLVAAFPNFPPGLMIHGHICESLDFYEEAVEQYELAAKLETHPGAIASLGHIHGLYGRVKTAREYLNQLESMQKRGLIAFVSSYCRALIFAGLGEKNRVLDELEKAFEEHCDWLIHLLVDPRWEPFRREPRFRKLVDRVGIPGAPEQKL